MKARALAGVACRPGGLHERKHRIAVAVQPQRAHLLHVPARRPLVPRLLARAAPQVKLAGLARARQRLLVHVGEHQHLAAAPVLHDTGHEAPLVVCDLIVDRLLGPCAHSLDCRSRPVGPGFRQTPKDDDIRARTQAARGDRQGGRGQDDRGRSPRHPRRRKRGARAIVVEVGDQARLPELFGVAHAGPGAEIELQEGLCSISIDPDRALLEWLQKLGGRVSGRVLASSSTFQYFAAAAPGAKELVSMVKIWELTQDERWRRGAASYDLVVIDGPATGHALGMLRSPSTFGAIARVGPIAGQSEQVQELLADPARSGYLAVAQGTEMAVTETLELKDDLHRHLDRDA